MKAIKLTPKAREDISGIWDYTRRTWGREQAERYLRDIQAALGRFSDRPALAIDSSHIRAGYRRFRVGSHIVFFRENDDGIEVVRILHGQMDFTRHL